MLQFEHINLVVSDVEAELKFYEAAFPHWRVRDSGSGNWHGKPYIWLHFGDDYQYLVFNDNGEGENRNLAGQQVGLAHFGFVTTNLDALVRRLTAAGFSRDSGGADESFRRNAYYIDPAGFEVEFVQYLSDIAAERNLKS